MGILSTPFIVPLGAFLVAIVAIISGITGQAHARRIKAEQRMAMLQRGMTADQIDLLLRPSKEDGDVGTGTKALCAASPMPGASLLSSSRSESASSSLVCCSQKSSATGKPSSSRLQASSPWPSVSASSSITTCRSANSLASASKSLPTHPPTAHLASCPSHLLSAPSMTVSSGPPARGPCSLGVVKRWVEFLSTPPGTPHAAASEL